MVGYNAFTFRALDEFRDLKGIDDEDIIPWCGEHDAIWVHADDNSKVEHKKRLETHGVKTIWLYRPKGRMSSKDQLRALTYALPRALDRLQKYQHIAIRVKGPPPEYGYSVTPFTL